MLKRPSVDGLMKLYRTGAISEAAYDAALEYRKAYRHASAGVRMVSHPPEDTRPVPGRRNRLDRSLDLAALERELARTCGEKGLLAVRMVAGEAGARTTIYRLGGKRADLDAALIRGLECLAALHKRENAA